MQYNTALRAYIVKRIEEIESADILVGIPCYNNGITISHVIQSVSHGLAAHGKGFRSEALVEDQADNKYLLKVWDEKSTAESDSKS